MKKIGYYSAALTLVCLTVLLMAMICRSKTPIEKTSVRESAHKADDEPKGSAIQMEKAAKVPALKTEDDFQASPETIRAYQDATVMGFSMEELHNPEKQAAAAEQVREYTLQHFQEFFATDYESDHLHEKYKDVELDQPQLQLPLYDARLEEDYAGDSKAFNQSAATSMAGLDLSKERFAAVPNLYRDSSDFRLSKDED